MTWLRTRTETDETETEDATSTGDEGTQRRKKAYASPLTFFSPMANTPNSRGDWKRKKSPTSKETETLKDKEERLFSDLFDKIVSINSLVDKQGPYKNTANEVKVRLRELQKLCGGVIDVRRMRTDKKEEELESSPKRAKRAVAVEEKGTNTSTGGEMEGLEWDDDLGTETEWTEVKTKWKQQRQKRKKIASELREKSERKIWLEKKDSETKAPGKTKKNLVITKLNKRNGRSKALNRQTTKNEGFSD